MFGFEWNEKEAQEALIKTGEARGKLEGKTEATTLNIKNLNEEYAPLPRRCYESSRNRTFGI